MENFTARVAKALKKQGMDTSCMTPSTIFLLAKCLKLDIDDEEEKQEEELDMPEASPLDIISKNDYKKLDKYLEDNYGHLRKYIDENYAALLVALETYEKVDFDAKMCKHIAYNIANNIKVL